MTKIIYKYPVSPRFSLSLPDKSQILTIQVQNGIPVLWALLDLDKPIFIRSFECFATGESIYNSEGFIYIGTFQTDNLVFHLFERKQ